MLLNLGPVEARNIQKSKCLMTHNPRPRGSFEMTETGDKHEEL